MNPRIMEVTLRDGSYLIDFQFTAADTRLLCSELERVGFRLIEVGHGIGIGASRSMGEAAATDVEYAEAAEEATDLADWGMFCIPGIGTLDDLERVADCGMDFVRIGTNVTEVEASEPFIRRAKDHGLMVCANYMKSYAVAPSVLADKARQSADYGADVLYVVDSAGGMTMNQVMVYVEAASEVGLPVAFHGHNNLDTAVTNAIVALDCGAEIVDTSLQGMGRSAGNVPTGPFLLAAESHGYSFGIDPLATMDIGERYVKPLIERVGYSSLDAVSGFAGFHSSYMGTIQRYAGKYGVDPRQLILRVTQHDQVHAPDELVESLAEQMASSEEPVAARYRWDRYHGAEETVSATSGSV